MEHRHGAVAHILFPILVTVRVEMRRNAISTRVSLVDEVSLVFPQRIRVEKIRDVLQPCSRVVRVVSRLVSQR